MYATIEDFIEAFGQDEAIALSNPDDPTAAYVDRPVIQRGLDNAAALIDTYLLAAGYVLPLSSLPDRLRHCACEIARYYLDRSDRETVRDRYKDEIAYLKDVAAGRVSLGLPLLVPTASPDLVRWYSRSRVFTDEALRGY